MIISVLAVLKAGGAYVPLDPGYPQERIDYMLKDVNAAVIITSSACKHLLNNAGNAQVICIDEDASIFANLATTDPKRNQQDGLAYIIYTSGSTGRPKGVCLQNSALVNLLQWQQRQLQNKHRRKVLQYASINFDVSFQEIFSTLCYGNILVLIAEDRRKDMSQLLHDLVEQQVTHLFVPYVVLKNLAEYVAESKTYPVAMEVVITAGEQLKLTADIDEMITRSGAILLNHYGPSEAHVVTSYDVLQKDYSLRPLPPVGKPIGNTTIYILDKGGHPVPIGVPGELYIGGVQVARGYLNLPEQTAEKFIPDPFSRIPGATLYRTGDQARWLPDGNIDFLGRRDHQVKIRGYRVELGEIETMLQQTPGVKKNVVVATGDKQGMQRLAAYIVSEGEFNKETIYTHLRQHLPDYMVPSLLIPIAEMPINQNGKVDRKKLPAVDADALLAKEYVAPRDVMETQLQMIWQQFLPAKRIGINDNFFELGGHSLLAMRILSAIKRQLNVDVDVKDLFNHPAIAALAALLRQRNPSKELPLQKREPGTSPLPLSFSQERLWFIHRLQGSVQYHLSWVCALNAEVDIEALNASFLSIVERHEVLRTTIQEEDGVGYQVVQPAGNWQWVYTTEEELTRSGYAMKDRVDAFVNNPFDLCADHLFRVMLIRTVEEYYLLVIVTHHIAFDGWSLDVLRSELEETYTRITEQLPPLQPLPVQYADYALWQRSYLSDEVLNEKLSYWKNQLRDVPPVAIVTDRIPPAERTVLGGIVYKATDKALRDKLVTLSQSGNVTLFMTMLAVFKVLLSRYSGQRDICVGTPIAGRLQPELEQLLGFFVNTLVLRTQINPEEDFLSLLHHVRQTTLDAHEHQEVPFEKIVEALGVERDLSRNPVFQVVFIIEHNKDDNPDLLLVPLEDTVQSTAQFDLSFHVRETPSGLLMSLSYSTDLFTAQTAKYMLNHYVRLLHQIAKDVHTPVAQLSLVSEEEEQQLLEFSGGTCNTSTKSIVDAFAEQVLQTPDSTALVFSEIETYTYRQLDVITNQLAHHLIQRGVKPEMPVPVCIERSAALIIAILAVLKAGGAYVPIDPSYPAARINYMLSDINASIIITAGANKVTLPEILNINIEAEAVSILQQPQTAPNITSTSSSLAYIMYTSGSTGTPKGVMIEHGNVVSLVKDVSYVTLNTSTVLLSTGSPSFDATTIEYWGTLLNGGRLVMCSQDVLFDNEKLKALIKLQGVGIMWFTAGWFNQLAETDIAVFENLHTVMAGGDRLSVQHIAKVKDQYPQLKIINGYGPTENTTFSLTHDIALLQEDREIPIGRPLDNRTAWVLDENYRCCAVGTPGEIAVGGAGLARGYWNQPALSGDRFRDIPGIGRVYLTGDLGRWLPDGTMAFLGRRDDQVKIRGYRVELGEIEAALQQIPGIRQAVVIAIDDVKNRGNKTLVAYIVTGKQFNRSKATTSLQGKLPPYMQPSILMEIDELPLTSNGKVDKKRLPEPVRQAVQTEYEAAVNEQEEQVAVIWQDLLRRDRVGVNDNFFDVGGHSLLMMRLLNRLRAYYEVSLRDLFAYPTIRSLANALHQRRVRDVRLVNHDHLLLLHAAESGIPLFILPGSDGFSDAYEEIARGVDSGPVYGVQMMGVLPAEVPLLSVESIAAQNIGWIKQVQPHGPYRLAGHSFGALVAYEMIKQLEAAGEYVETMVVLDMTTEVKVYDVIHTHPVYFAMEVAWTVFKHTGLITKPFPAWADRLEKALESLTIQEMPAYIAAFLRKKLDGAPVDMEYLFRLVNLQVTNHLISYKATGRINAAILVIRASNYSVIEGDGSLGWSAFADDISVGIAPGTHFTMIKGDNAPALSALLNNHLNTPV